jgi:hypothetical protein
LLSLIEINLGLCRINSGILQKYLAEIILAIFKVQVLVIPIFVLGTFLIIRIILAVAITTIGILVKSHFFMLVSSLFLGREKYEGPLVIVVKKALEHVSQMLQSLLVLFQALKNNVLEEKVLVRFGGLGLYIDLEVDSLCLKLLGLFRDFQLKLLDDFFLKVFGICVTIEIQLELNLVRYGVFNKVAHVLPIGGLIIRLLSFRKLNHGICDEDFSWLGGVEMFDNMIIFLFERIDDHVYFERCLKIFLAPTTADNSWRLDRILD